MSYEPVFLNSGFNCDRKQWSAQFRTNPVGKSLTQQHEAEGTDINVIMARYLKSGELPVVPRPPQFGDFDTDLTYRDCMDILNEGKRSFMMLDAQVRAKFDNDPVAFLEFCDNPENLDEMRKLGIALPAKVPEPDKVMKVEVVNPVVDKPAKGA